MSEYWYNGKSERTREFKSSENRMADRAAIGFWFAPFDEASRYGRYVRKCILRLDNPLRITQRELDFMAVSEPMRQVISRLKRLGHDGLTIEAIPESRVLEEQYQAEQRVVFDASQIEVVDLIDTQASPSNAHGLDDDMAP